ncbi:MAG: hydantoinase/oxoprolinase family protein [Alphaproteobacteria bacterium]
MGLAREGDDGAATAVAGDGVRVGIDIGGTFTDIVAARPDGRLHVAKVSSTTRSPDRAVVEGLADLLNQNGISSQDVVEIVHGSTVASNTILQKTGARTGLITTRGFRDVLEIARIRTPEMFDLTWSKPEPLVPRRLRLEVDERIAADGGIVRPLVRDSVISSVERLIEAGMDSLAIVFINSHANPAHEKAAEELVRQRWPELAVSASWRVLPEIKEYERTSTTVVNAYLQPVMRTYLERLQSGLREIGIEAPLLMIASNGGVSSARATAERPVFAVGSGPAAGVAGAARLGVACGYRDLIAFDMGGTTAKAALVDDGQLTLTTEYEFREGISTSSRFIKAGGYMLKVPAIDIAEVGAGGGSIAHVDAGGLLHVGPRSAGAVPGPVCYGLGGDEPTVTDASVAIGYLNPNHLAGGSLKIDRDMALDAISSRIAEPLGIDTIDAAHGIRAVANANMARALRAVSVERGRDPRDFALMVFGGSAALHGVELARMLAIGTVIVPNLPGVFTAVGMLTSDIEHHLVRPFSSPLRTLASDVGKAELDRLRDDALMVLREEGYGPGTATVAISCDLRYRKQALELTVPLAGDGFDDAALDRLRRDFKAAYAQRFGYTPEHEEPDVVNLRAIGVGHRTGRLDFAGTSVEAPSAADHARFRPVSFVRGEPPIDTPVCDRDDIDVIDIPGPLIVETYESTIVVPPGASIRRDDYSNLLITP